MNALQEFSRALAAHAASAAPLLAAIRLSSTHTLSAVHWQADALVTSEQSLPAAEAFEVVLAGGQACRATVAGRDPGTNVAALRLEAAGAATSVARASACRVGELAFAYGVDEAGHPRARVGIVNSVGPAWHSRAGGRLASRIALDITLARREEGGPVLNATGELVGMSTFGRRADVMVIPAETIERVLPALMTQGRVSRGWLGVTLQPVAVPHALREAAGSRGAMMVMSIVDDAPAARAGLSAGDILLTVNGVPALRMDKVASQLGDDSIGGTVALRVIRGGAVITLEAIISARPAT
jgi:S1-C subfamily serine protease